MIDELSCKTGVYGMRVLDASGGANVDIEGNLVQ